MAPGARSGAPERSPPLVDLSRRAAPTADCVALTHIDITWASVWRGTDSAGPGWKGCFGHELGPTTVEAGPLPGVGIELSCCIDEAELDRETYLRPTDALAKRHRLLNQGC